MIGSRSRVLKAQNKNCPIKLPKIATAEEAHKGKHDTSFYPGAVSHRPVDTITLTVVSLFLLKQPEVPLPLNYLAVPLFNSLLLSNTTGNRALLC